MAFKDKQRKADWQRDYMKSYRKTHKTQVRPDSKTQAEDDKHFKGVAALVSEMAGSESAVITPKGELIPDSQLTCRYCGQPADQPSLQCNRHKEGKGL